MYFAAAPGVDRELEFISKDQQQTAELAAEFATFLQPGDVVALQGDLGSGKTVTARAIARALGYEGNVTSPTFTLLNIYPAEKMPVYHFDFYRIATSHEAVDIGALDYFEGEGICLVEWPERVADILPAGSYFFSLDIPDYHTDPDKRTIVISRSS